MHDLQLMPLIVETVAKMAGLKAVKRLYSNDRAPTLVHLRDTIFFMIRKKTGLSFPEIGRHFNKNHSSVLISVQRETLRLQRCPPRRDGLTWAAYHEKISAEIDKVAANTQTQMRVDSDA